MPLGEIHLQGPQFQQGGIILDEFGNGLNAHDLRQLMNGCNHGAVDRVIHHITDEGSVDLEIIDWQVLEVTKGTKATAEIIQRETTAHGLQGVDKLLGLGEIGDRGRFGDLEADAAGGLAESADLGTDEIQKTRLAEGGAGNVDGKADSPGTILLQQR